MKKVWKFHLKRKYGIHYWREKAKKLQTELKMSQHKVEYWREKCKFLEKKRTFHHAYSQFDIRSIKAKKREKK